jgi:hypothetical protein
MTQIERRLVFGPVRERYVQARAAYFDAAAEFDNCKSRANADQVTAKHNAMQVIVCELIPIREGCDHTDGRGNSIMREYTAVNGTHCELCGYTQI